jgi:hypothetical protein
MVLFDQSQQRFVCADFSISPELAFDWLNSKVNSRFDGALGLYLTQTL